MNFHRRSQVNEIIKQTKPSPYVKILLAAALASALATAPSFAAEPGGKPEKPDIVVTYAQPSGAFTPIWVAYEAGLFKKYGLNAKLQLLTPQVSAQAVIAEEADFYTDGPDLINARLHGGQVKYFGGTMQQLVFEMWGAKEIKSIQDLKGKAVAASTPRAALDTATREALKKNGKTYTAHIYPGVNHGFHNDTTPRYDTAAAKLASSFKEVEKEVVRTSILETKSRIDGRE